MNELDLFAAHEHAEAAYLYCRKVAFANRVPVPQDVREFFNREVPALLGELKRLRDQLAAEQPEPAWCGRTCGRTLSEGWCPEHGAPAEGPQIGGAS